jgi:hypothetical protein
MSELDLKLKAIVSDIYKVLENGVEVDPQDVEEFGKELSSIIASRLLLRSEPREFYLRMSSVGKPARKLWYESRQDPNQPVKLHGSTLLKFMYGDILEALLLFLCKQSGHKVNDQQKEVEIDGVKGHIDATIDDILIDVKSASNFSFNKFKFGSLYEDDSFGYTEQLSSYRKALGAKEAAFLAVNKETGEICTLELPDDVYLGVDVTQNIATIKEALLSEEAPDRCYSPVPDGKSGNMKLPVACAKYCDFRDKCWSDINNGFGLRVFEYASGPVFFTEVVSEPRVPERIKISD